MAKLTHPLPESLRINYEIAEEPECYETLLAELRIRRQELQRLLGLVHLQVGRLQPARTRHKCAARLHDSGD